MSYPLSNVCLNDCTELCEIMGKYGSDKGSKDITISCHNYSVVYYNLFTPMKI
jgi:hypothetical protein